MTVKPLELYFQNPAILNSALIHRSYCNEHPGTVSNERLEFLGDSGLSLIISDRSFTLFPHLPERASTARRSYLVQTSTLAAKATQLDLSAKLLLSRGEEDSGGRLNPGLLANTFEAVVGALFQDSGITACYTYLTDVFPDSELTSHYEIKDPKSQLQEKSQSLGWGTPSYRTVSSTGPDHAKKFTLAVAINGREAAIGTGSSKQRAETDAARAALKSLFPE